LLFLWRVVGTESPDESVLPGSCQKTSLLRAGWLLTGVFDLHRGPPNLKVSDQASRQYAISFNQGRSFAGRADLIG
jgi:hypothetical protein